MAGRALLLAGAPGTGKTALALGIAQVSSSSSSICHCVYVCFFHVSLVVVDCSMIVILD